MVMTQTIDFIFDFGSPNAYLAWKVLPKMAEKKDATIRYVPSLLGGIFKATNNQPPWRTYGSVTGKLEYEQLEMTRFIEKHALTKFKFNPHFPINTLLIMRGACAAEAAGNLDAYVTAGMTAMWEDGLNMSDPEVFVSMMNIAGLDGQALLTSTQDPKIKQRLLENTNAAVSRGVFGIPSYFIDDEMWFGKDRIRDLIETL
jgi:2-hydroxychromene-2-carboxylate isomerase